MTTDALFKHIELLQGKKPWGRLLDAGTGSASLRWITSLDTLSWTAITAELKSLGRVRSGLMFLVVLMAWGAILRICIGSNDKSGDRPRLVT